MKRRKNPDCYKQVTEPTWPWEEIDMDFIVELPESEGNSLIWTVVDLFSKQTHFVACTEASYKVQKLTRMFLQIYRLHGVPKRIISDIKLKWK